MNFQNLNLSNLICIQWAKFVLLENDYCNYYFLKYLGLFSVLGNLENSFGRMKQKIDKKPTIFQNPEEKILDLPLLETVRNVCFHS